MKKIIAFAVAGYLGCLYLLCAQQVTMQQIPPAMAFGNQAKELINSNFLMLQAWSESVIKSNYNATLATLATTGNNILGNTTADVTMIYMTDITATTNLGPYVKIGYLVVSSGVVRIWP